MSDTTNCTQHLIEQILKQHDSYHEIKRVLTNNLAFKLERESSNIGLVRFKNALKAMPTIIDEQEQAREPNRKGWVLKISSTFKQHTGFSVGEIDYTKNLRLLKLLTQVRNKAAEILESVSDLVQISKSDYEQLKKDFDLQIQALLEAGISHDR